MKDILIFCSDGHTGIKEALAVLMETLWWQHTGYKYIGSQHPR